ncbi:gamma carbonic anhydrase family protein [Pelagibacterium lentulum]|uniref:Gamma carbonic anhydrase family protein n=1 Tax=Pelagibacterium lentulum TaxID=2029865 RepID=A0A916VXJ3_9HYPH|nr:gamma carbonic anhydrase family protein [Pelagibacterium lentulum]GGA50048.1 gamma carbonic anhydrase family protein [Pelagibacterium lentulum]
MPRYSLDGTAPQIDPNVAWIAPNAVLVGKVIVQADVGIWFGVVARGDNEVITIGQGSNVQENTVLHTDMGFPLTIGRGCTIGHKAMLHGCTIGNDSLIGMGAIVLNGARIGDNCLIGAGALITEGTQVPDGSLVVGSPGKVIRQLDEAAIAGLQRSAEGYIRNAHRFAAGLVHAPKGSDFDYA